MKLNKDGTQHEHTKNTQDYPDGRRRRRWRGTREQVDTYYQRELAAALGSLTMRLPDYAKHYEAAGLVQALELLKGELHRCVQAAKIQAEKE